eukprot:scaffold277706_cov19-Tisochrysis_lutea.AAC.2
MMGTELPPGGRPAMPRGPPYRKAAQEEVVVKRDRCHKCSCTVCPVIAVPRGLTRPVCVCAHDQH